MCCRKRTVLTAFSLIFLFQFVSTLSAQSPPKDSIKTFTTSENMEVQLFAHEPMIANPIAMDIDTLGRVWVTEGVNYRRNVSNPPDNKIKVLEDTNGDGVADKVTIFASDLNAAMGICVAGTKIYVAESPFLYVYEDQNGDLKADGPRKVLLKGLGKPNHDHGLHSLVFGPDHKLYMTVGDTGYDVSGTDGRRLKYSWGGLIRCEADGARLESVAVNFRNPFELTVDSFGNVWCSDNDNDGLKSVRICWILEGGNYGWYGGPEMIREPDGSFDPIHHWRADKPGNVPHALITGFGSPCGMTFYEGDAFGPEFRGQIVHCDAGPQEVRTYTPRRLSGIGFQVQAKNILTGSDRYFRPDDVCTAPDGSLFVSDWYDGGVGGHAYNDPTRGRIYRLSPRGKTLIRSEKPGPYQNDEDALGGLASPNLATQYLARERLIGSGEAAVQPLIGVLNEQNQEQQARALWVLDRMGDAGQKIVLSQLKSPQESLRALAVRILRRHDDKFLEQITAELATAEGEVLKEILLALGSSRSAKSTAAVIQAFERYDGKDRFLLEALLIAAKGRESLVFNAVVEKQTDAVDPRLLEIIRALKPQDASRYLSSRLAGANLSDAARTTLITALSAVPSVEAGRSLIVLLAKSQPTEVKRLILAALQRNLNGVWRTLKSDAQLHAGIRLTLQDQNLAVPALDLVAEAGFKQHGDLVGKWLTQNDTSDPILVSALRATESLMLIDVVENLPTFLESDKLPIREAALAAFVAIREPKSINKLFDRETSQELKQRAADALCQSSDGALLLLRLIESKKLDAALSEHIIQVAVEHPDVNVRLLFEKFIPAEKRPKTLGGSLQADDILKLSGDIKRGQAVFLRSGAASCSNCHRVRGQGADIGPDLSQIGRKYELRTLLDTILYPSKGIAPEYQPYVVATKSGRVYAGFLNSQRKEGIELKSIDGKLVQIPQAEIDELVKQDKSLMPELALKNITAQDAADLLAYLASLQEVEVYATKFLLAGPFSNLLPEDRLKEYGPEKTAELIDRKAQFPSAIGAARGWRSVESASAGAQFPLVDLVAVANREKTPATQVIYYLAARIDSTVAQPAKLHIGADDGVQVWLNGVKVLTNFSSRQLDPRADTIPVELRAGPNVVLLKIDQGGGPAGASLSVEARGSMTLGLP